MALAHEWADTPATFKSYELLARYVMPHFQGQMDPIVDARNWFEDARRDIFGQFGEATVNAFKDAGKEVPEQIAAMLRPRKTNDTATV